MYTGCKFCFFFYLNLPSFPYVSFFLLLLLFLSVSLFHWLSCFICCGYCCCISLSLLLLSSRETHVRVYRMNYFLLETMYIYSNIYAVSFACLGVCVCVCRRVCVCMWVFQLSFVSYFSLIVCCFRLMLVCLLSLLFYIFLVQSASFFTFFPIIIFNFSSERWYIW